MNHTLSFIVLFSVTIAFVLGASNVTPSEQCAGLNFDDLRDRIQVIPCGKTRCKLQKNANTTVIFKFKPKHDVKSLVNDVSGIIAGIPLPFIGVTGNNACNNVIRVDTGEPHPCPLKAGEEYAYTNVFPILPIYPSVDLRVHWSLNDGDKSVICFEVPAVITVRSKNN